MSPRPLNATAQRVLSEIAAFIAENRFSPTIGELCERVKRNRSTVHAHLRSLQRADLIEWNPGRPRTLRIRIHND